MGRFWALWITTVLLFYAVHCDSSPLQARAHPSYRPFDDAYQTFPYEEFA